MAHAINKTVDMSERAEVAGVSIRVAAAHQAALSVAADVFLRRLRVRCGETAGHEPTLAIELAIDGALGIDAYSISDVAEARIRVCGGDRRGVLYGLGRLLHDARFAPGRFVPGTWRGASRPAKATRGIYFATHFNNFYQTAPVAKIQWYIEDLVLWGMNALMIWYDMHHFDGFDDPEAGAFRARLRDISTTARGLGLDIWLVVVGNEAYADSPQDLRATAGGGRGGFYDVAVCPAKPGGTDYILGVLGQYFDWARDLHPSAVCIWPYDQGGCGCDDCRPWAARGFMRCVQAVGRLVRTKLPGTKIVLSTWLMDQAEWNEVAAHVRSQPNPPDAILMELFHNPFAPAPLAEGGALGLPVIGFPEISMDGMFPWGGFGANPQPARFTSQWHNTHRLLDGGFPYSEGIFDDINKVLWLQLYWRGGVDTDSILHDYIAYEFPAGDSEAIAAAIHTLEHNHHFRWWPGMLDGVKILMDWFPARNAQPQPDPGAEEAYATVEQVDARLPVWARQSWRWRLVYVRALLDAELKRNGGRPNAACLDGFRELDRLACVTPETESVVRAPCR